MRVFRHFAWFNQATTGLWIGEWAGHVPAPVVDETAKGDDRRLQLEAWQQQIQECITPFGGAVAIQLHRYGALFDCEGSQWDFDRWDACPNGGAVCLDVTQFGWPVGDHVWHVWNRTDRLLDWPDASWHRFIEIRMDTLDVVANQSSHRPIRDAVPGQRVFDITGTPLAEYHGMIWGRFVRRGDRWGFAPSASPAVPVPPTVRAALTEAPVDFVFAGERKRVEVR